LGITRKRRRETEGEKASRAEPRVRAVEVILFVLARLLLFYFALFNSVAEAELEESKR
jgi:hypothetical protein